MLEGTIINYCGIKPRWTRDEKSYVGEIVILYERDEDGAAVEQSFTAATIVALYMDSMGRKYAKIEPKRTSRFSTRHLILFDLRRRHTQGFWDMPERWFAFEGEEV